MGGRINLNYSNGDHTNHVSSWAVEFSNAEDVAENGEMVNTKKMSLPERFNPSKHLDLIAKRCKEEGYDSFLISRTTLDEWAYWIE